MNYKKFSAVTLLSASLCLSLSACQSNPLQPNNDHRYVGAGMGAIAGVGVASLVNASTAMTILSALAGAGAGYYLTGVDNDVNVIKQAGGQAYRVGDYVTIVIPSYTLFDAGKASLLPNTDASFAAIAAILKQYPRKNILVTSNTAGLFSKADDLALSKAQAQKVADVLWNLGINSNNNTRKVEYAGFGDSKPIANGNFNQGINQNRRIQITVYPSVKA